MVLKHFRNIIFSSHDDRTEFCTERIKNEFLEIFWMTTREWNLHISCHLYDDFYVYNSISCFRNYVLYRRTSVAIEILAHYK